MSAAVDINVLYENLEEMGVEVFDCPLSQFSAVAEPAGYLGLNPSQISSVEQEREILIHEEGHFATNTFYQLDSPYTVRQHQENLAARHGIKKYFSVEKLLSLMEQGYTESWQLAEQLGVRPAYIQEMLDYYTQAQGVNFSWELKKRRRARETQEALEADPLTEATRLELSDILSTTNRKTAKTSDFQKLPLVRLLLWNPLLMLKRENCRKWADNICTVCREF